MKPYIKNLLVLGACLICSYLIYQQVSGHFTLESLRAYAAFLHLWVLDNYVISVAIYMLAYFLVVASFVPIVAPMSMIGGFLFGTFPTVLFSTIAATCGATVSFLFLRFLSTSTIDQKYALKILKFKRKLDEQGSLYLLLLHFMFVVPFFVINSLAAFAGVSLWCFVWTTAIGFLPCAFVYAFAGNSLFSISSLNDVFSLQIIVAIVLLILAVVLPIVIRHYKKSLNS